MKQHPISFSTTMVEAILANRKTMTRRPKRIQPSEYEKEVQVKIIPTLTSTYTVSPSDYGVVGDQLWVRETYYQFGHWKRDGLTKKGNPKWKFVPYPPQKVYYEDTKPNGFKKSRDKANPDIVALYKRNARFMPKLLARIILEITELREERLQDISEEDVVREGINHLVKNNQFGLGKAVHDFQQLWASIYGPLSWYENPVVNVIGFKVIKK